MILYNLSLTIAEVKNSSHTLKTGICDATNLNDLSRLGAKSARLTERDSIQAVSVNELLEKLCRQFWVYGESDDDEGKLDCQQLGKMARRYIRSVPSASFMNGPVKGRYEVKQRKQRTASTQPLTQATQPKTIDSSREEETMTDKRVSKLLKSIHRKINQPTNVFKLAINPKSYTGTFLPLSFTFFTSYLIGVQHAIHSGAHLFLKCSLILSLCLLR